MAALCVTDTYGERTVTSNLVGFSLPMTMTARKSGTECTVTVTGGLGSKTYEWMCHQGRYYGLSDTGTSITLEPNRFTKCMFTVKDAAGIQRSVEIDATTGQSIS